MTPKRDATTKVERPTLYVLYEPKVPPATAIPWEAFHAEDANRYMDQQDERVRGLEEALRLAVFWVSTWSEDYQRIVAALGEKNV